MYCREFRQEVSIHGAPPEIAQTAACRDPGGMWHPAPDNP
jgi:surface antigen